MSKNVLETQIMILETSVAKDEDVTKAKVAELRQTIATMLQPQIEVLEDSATKDDDATKPKLEDLQGTQGDIV